MGYQTKQIPTLGSGSRCIGEFQMFQSSLLPVWSILSVNSVNVDETWMWNIIFICTLTIVIHWFHCLIKMAKANSSTIELVNWITSDFVISSNFAIWVFASKCFPIELVPCSDGWQRSSWQIIYIISWLPISSIPQCKLCCNEEQCLEIFQAIGPFKSTFIEAH